MKKISIVTISFNQRDFLEQCIKSVASQSGNWEHIIVDPGSTDGSRDLIMNYEKHFSHIIFENDSGPADGLNRGFSKAAGDVGYFLNSDDFLLPGAIEFLNEHWEAHGDELDVLLCSAWKVDALGLPTSILIPTAPSASSFAAGLVAVVQQGMSFRMSAFNSAGGFNTENRTCWDGELLASFVSRLLRCNVSYHRLAAFRIHGESISGGAGGAALALRYQADSLRIRNTYFPQFVNVRPKILELLHWLSSRCINPRRIATLVFYRVFPQLMLKKWFSESLGV